MPKQDNSSTFDPDTFLHSETTESLETNYTAIEEGEYDGYIDDVVATVFDGKDGAVPILEIIYNLTKF